MIPLFYMGLSSEYNINMFLKMFWFNMHTNYQKVMLLIQWNKSRVFLYIFYSFYSHENNWRIISINLERRSGPIRLVFIEVPVPSQVSERPCICVLVVSILSMLLRFSAWILKLQSNLSMRLPLLSSHLYLNVTLYFCPVLENIIWFESLLMCHLS